MARSESCCHQCHPPRGRPRTPPKSPPPCSGCAGFWQLVTSATEGRLRTHGVAWRGTCRRYSLHARCCTVYAFCWPKRGINCLSPPYYHLRVLSRLSLYLQTAYCMYVCIQCKQSCNVQTPMCNERCRWLLRLALCQPHNFHNVLPAVPSCQLTNCCGGFPHSFI